MNCNRGITAGIAVSVITVMLCAVTPGYAHEESGEDRVSGVAGLTFLSERNARGMVLEDQGLIMQGLLGINFQLTDNITLTTGVWTDIHNNNDGPGPDAAAAGAGVGDSDLENFYEFDWWIGVDFEIGQLNVLAYYEEFLNPADDLVSQTGGFESRHIQTVFTYDGLGDNMFGMDGVNLSPYVRLLFEMDGSVGPTAKDGIYIELGVGPSFTAIQHQTNPVTVTFPIAVGLGSDFYEDDETFGFLSVGAKASMPLPQLSDWGSWSLSVGVNAVIANDDAVGAFNSGVAGQSDDTRLIGYVSIGIGF